MTTSTRCLAAALSIGMALGLIRGAPASAQAARETAGQAVTVVGPATVVRVAVREPLRQGATVHVGDRVITGPDGRVRVRLVDGALLVVGPKTEIVVRAAGRWGGRRTVSLNLVFGIARAIAPPNHRTALEIWTSAAIASVRHTDWIVVVSADRTAVFAAEGAVDVAARRRQGQWTLRAGQGVDLLTNGQVLGPRAWGPARVAAVKAATSFR